MGSIIHFTKTFSNLKGILQEKSFRLYYCREDFYFGAKLASAAVHPMVCFSDQNLKNISDKKITYGQYGIGMRKKWVNTKKLHPVLYLDKNSHVANALTTLLKARRKGAEVDLAPLIRHSIITLKCFIKNARGYNSYFNVRNFNFKAEKEWRFVPTKSEIKDNLISRDKKKYNVDPDFYNNKLKPFPLCFSIIDVEILFVKTEREAAELCRMFGIDRDKVKISRWKVK